MRYGPIADLLREMPARRLVVLGAALLAGGLGLAAATESKALVSLLSPIIGTGIVALGLGAYRGAAAVLGERTATVLAWSLFGLVVAVGAFVYASYRYNRETAIVCRQVTGSGYPMRDSIYSRRAALEDAERRLTSVWSAVPRWLGHLPYECKDARADLARQDRGLCPEEPLEGVSCICGDRVWPDDTGCRKKPSCTWRTPGVPEQFNCWQDRL